MNNKYLNFLTDLFSSGETPSQDKLMQLAEETMAFFREIKVRISSEDEETKKEALEELAQIKGVLEEKLKQVSEKTGMSPEQLSSFAKTMMASQHHEGIRKFSENLQKGDFAEKTFA